MSKSTIKPTVYLIKEHVSDLKDIFKNPDKLQTQHIDTKDDTEINGALFYKDSAKRPPKWLPFIQAEFVVDTLRIFNSSSYAVIVIKTNDRFFAIPFGMGSHLIDTTKIEYNFGLKVAINCIPQNDLKQINLTTPEASSQKTLKQAPKKSTPNEMGINQHKDILRGLAGDLPNNHSLGKRVEGKDSVRPTKNVETLIELKALCTDLLEYSKKEDYKEKFPWIDNMSITSDPMIIDSLFDELLKSIKSENFDHMYFSTPEFVSNIFSYEGFVFKGNKKRNKIAYPFPEMPDFYSDFGKAFIDIMDQEQLRKKCKVYLRNEDGDDRFGWPLSRCIAWETIMNGKKYILSDGEWYQVNQTFYDEITSFFQSHVNSDINLPDASQNYDREANYNFTACTNSDCYHLFDLGHPKAKHKTITSAGNEICDIFDSNNKRFIHVKPGKSSSAISHLMRQGAFSAQIIQTEPVERKKFQGYLNEDSINVSFLDNYNPQNFIVTFALILGKTQNEDIPFFSKVSFKDAATSITSMGYKCEFGYINTITAPISQLELVA
ncbi:DUF6119 family protein [Polycladidibacter stylochi]|uniref:DUF6119 family protein n=1 Tax=Polycladidibacter stylochi TaxID=1807766 RepID=UPI000830B421|nr:DUF6119 family protein [Pseudovibrio stylochi]